MPDLGMRISKPGYDVKTCADRELGISSSFQTLKVFDAVKATCLKPPIAGVESATFSHNLGFIAPFIVIYNGSDTTGVNVAKPVRFVSAESEPYNSSLNATVLVYDGFEPSVPVGDTLHFTIYVFFDDFRDVTPYNVTIPKTVTGTIDTDFGYRVSKTGVDVKTGSDEDMAFSSKFGAQIVHAKGTELTGAGIKIVNHGLGYIPTYLSFFEDVSPTTITAGFISPMSPNATINFTDTTDLTLAIGSVSSPVPEFNLYYVIFKDTANETV